MLKSRSFYYQSGNTQYELPKMPIKKHFVFKKYNWIGLSLGYLQYRCPYCASQFNEGTNTPFNFLEFPTDVLMLTVFYYYHFENSLVDVTEHMALRGFSLSHETVRLWSQKAGTEISLKFRSRRHSKCGKKWHMNITYLKMQGRDMYLYRAIDKQGNLTDVYLSDKKAAKRFFTNCFKTTGIMPIQITTDKKPAFPCHYTVTWRKSKTSQQQIYEQQARTKSSRHQITYQHDERF